MTAAVVAGVLGGTIAFVVVLATFISVVRLLLLNPVPE